MSKSESREIVTLNTVTLNPLLSILSPDASSPQSHFHMPPAVITLSRTGTMHICSRGARFFDLSPCRCDSQPLSHV